MPAAPLAVTRHASEIGSWEMATRSASARLSPHVLGYCGYDERTLAFNRRRELPSGEVIVIIGFGPALETTYPDRDGDPGGAHRSFVAGIHETHCLVASPGTQAGIQVNMTPLGAHLLLGVPMHELANTVVELDDLPGGAGDPIVERLHDAGGWEARFELLDAILERRLDAARPASPDVAWAWRRIVASGGTVAIGDLCAELGCSRRHMLRRFGEQIGVSPKAFASILRFQRAVHLLGHRDGPSWIDGAELGVARELTWGEIALECGYFDQAHMNRDFRRLAGITPGELAASLLPDGGGLPG